MSTTTEAAIEELDYQPHRAARLQVALHLSGLIEQYEY